MNALQLWILAGLMVSGGLVTIGLYFVPAQPDLADALGRLSPTTGARQPATESESRPELADRLGLWAMRHLPSRLWGVTPHRDLAILGRSTHRFYGEKLMMAFIVAAGVPILAASFAITFPIPAPFVIAAVLIVPIFGWFVPNGNVATAAKEARLEFNRALGSYVDLVALERSAGGSAARQALENAAEIGDSWPFRRISETLARSRFSGQQPWDALHDLASQLAVPDLDDLADIMRLCGEEGAQVYDTLRAKAEASRNALLAADQADANAAGQRMFIPASLPAVVTVTILLVPAIMRLLTT